MPEDKRNQPAIHDRISLAEIRKWQRKLGPKLETMPDDEYATNVRAYYSDSFHFVGKGDYVRAFEAIVWAWAWYEILFLKNNNLKAESHNTSND